MNMEMMINGKMVRRLSPNGGRITMYQNTLDRSQWALLVRKVAETCQQIDALALAAFHKQYQKGLHDA